jgi:hypothetical protein
MVSDNATVGRKFGMLQPNLARCDEDFHGKPAVVPHGAISALPGMLTSVNSTEMSSHDSRRATAFIGIGGRDGHKACLPDGFDGKHPQPRLVFYDKNDR